MDTDMDKEQAQELAKRIQREAPHLTVKVASVEAVGWNAWAVYIFGEDLNEPLPIESPSAWEVQKSAFLLP